MRCPNAQRAGHGESWRGSQQSAAGIWQNQSSTAEQGSVWEMPGCLQMPWSCGVKICILKVKQMTAQLCSMHHPKRDSAGRQWPPASGFLRQRGSAGPREAGGTSLGHAMAQGRRDPSCLYNLGRSEVDTLTLL